MTSGISMMGYRDILTMMPSSQARRWHRISRRGEVDALFGVESVKGTFSGAGYKELSENLDRALKAQAGVKDHHLDDGRERDSAR